MSSTALYESGRNSLTNLIGWFSLCLVAAGWGAEFDTTIRHLWANIGLFGLVSMIGLKVVQWSRLKKQQRATELRVDNDMKRISCGKQTTALLIAELDRLGIEEHEYKQIERKSHSTDDELISLISHWVQMNPQIDHERR
ncbi:MAG: hypothetical protein ABIK07_10285 [Planctomycetota bacterium]|jgi:hypothetical protein|uniref:hypothetical protein n=1 Tax=uncultured Gimesia sp. TaxID=1678688 RepID=UPI002608FF4D|nr:hypothetical protein [uncultured Gimesia sp.]